MSKDHSHSHSHGHGHSHDSSWKPDFSKWESNPDFQKVYKKIAKEVLYYVDEKDSKKMNLNVLDFGCGPGLVLKTLLKDLKKGLIKHSVAADIELKFLEYAGKTLAEYRATKQVETFLLQQLDGSDLEPMIGSFDIIICTLVLGHIEEKYIPSVIKNLALSLKTGGFIFVSEFDNIKEQDSEMDTSKAKSINDGGVAHTSVTREELAKQFESHGCTVDFKKEVSFDLKLPNDKVYKAFGLFIKNNRNT